MTFESLISSLTADSAQSAWALAPEITLCATIVLMLLVRLPRIGQRLNVGVLALAGALVALYFTAPWTNLGPDPDPRVGSQIFTGLLVFDSLTVYFRTVLLAFAALFIVLTWLTGIPDREDGPDIYTLVLGGTLGMSLMCSANHLFMVFLAVEMASVPSYVLAGLLKGRKQSSEAALKYAVYGAGAAGVMLYGISLLTGLTGTAHMPTMARELAAILPAASASKLLVLATAGLMVMVGLAFKLSAVPFHFWCPDVFEGAAAEVNAFLSVASKAAALALLLRVALGLGAGSHLPEIKAPHAAPQADVARPSPSPLVLVSQAAHAPTADEVAQLEPARKFMAALVGLIAAVTCTFGNLAAYGQTNIKRLLAYSTIGHAGYMMLPVSAALTMAGANDHEARSAVASIAFYVGAYLFMNLSAFAIVAILRNAMRSEEIADYGGLIRTNPVIAVCFTLVLVSLIGIPPLVGFTAKFLVFASLAEAGLWTLLAIAGLNTVLALFYYLRVIKVMCIDGEPANRLPVEVSLLPEFYVLVVTLPVLVLGVWWDGLNVWANAAVRQLLN